MVLSADVTLRSLVLGSRDSTTGHREPSYSTSTIECLHYPHGASDRVTGVGVYAREDAMFLSADPAEVYDQLLTQDSRYFLIKTKKKHDLLDSFLFYEYQCHELPMWQAPPTSATWKTSPNDPRERTKVYVDTYIRAAQITKNDGSTEASWACIFENWAYPMAKEFRAASSQVQGLYVVAQPNSTPLLDSDQKPCLYKERVPVDIYTVDSTGCSGDPLAWKMEAEWRYVTENYVTGSQRSLESRMGTPIDLGGETLYHIATVLNYVRDTT